MIRSAITFLIGMALLTQFGSAQAQQKWNMPTPYADTNFHTTNIRQFAAEVKAETGGKLEIVVHSGASLFKLPEIKRAVQSGQVPLGETLMSSLANEDPIFEATNVPFLAKGFDKAAILWDAIHEHVEERLKKQGLILLFAAPWPSQGIYAKDPIKSVADFKGLKMRTYDRPTSRFAELIGAVPTTIQAAEIPQAFATGIISSMITSATTGADTKSWDYVRNYYDFQAMITRNIVIVNARMFNALDPATQKIILAAGKRALDRGTKTAMELETKSKETLKQNGVNVIAPGPELSGAMDKIGETITNEWAQRAGVNGANILKLVRSH
jgi:TRAP-type C4-dicarboxylate transport system substrate-binding protein